MAYDPKKIYFPSGDIIRPFAHAFVEAMLAQADLETTFSELQGVISGKRDFGRRNRWPAEDRPKKLARLIKDHLGSIPEAAGIRKILKDAIPAYRARNLLAHGHWYNFDPGHYLDPPISRIEARAWHGEAAPRTFTVADIWALRDLFKDFSAELHKLRYEIERRGKKKRKIGTKRRATTSRGP